MLVRLLLSEWFDSECDQVSFLLVSPLCLEFERCTKMEMIGHRRAVSTDRI